MKLKVAKVMLAGGVLLGTLAVPTATAVPDGGVDARVDDIESFIATHAEAQRLEGSTFDIDLAAYLEERDPGLLTTVDVELVETMTAVWPVEGDMVQLGGTWVSFSDAGAGWIDGEAPDLDDFIEGSRTLSEDEYELVSAIDIVQFGEDVELGTLAVTSTTCSSWTQVRMFYDVIFDDNLYCVAYVGTGVTTNPTFVDQSGSSATVVWHGQHRVRAYYEPYSGGQVGNPVWTAWKGPACSQAANGSWSFPSSGSVGGVNRIEIASQRCVG